jgi:hypothetical protein
MLHKIAISLVIGYCVLAAAWDIFLATFTGALGSSSFCQAAREINEASGGLLAIGCLGLWIHVFLFWYLPKWWTGL